MFACRVHLEKGLDLEEWRARVNAALPADIKVFCCLEVSKAFNAKNCTSNREYSYYLPTFLLIPVTEIYLATKDYSKKKEEEKKNAEEIK